MILLQKFKLESSYLKRSMLFVPLFTRKRKGSLNSFYKWDSFVKEYEEFYFSSKDKYIVGLQDHSSFWINSLCDLDGWV